MLMKTGITAGVGTVQITPARSIFLSGYPHVARYSTGVHDPLLSSSLYFQSGVTKVLMIANDVIYVPAQSARRVRKEIEKLTGVPERNILISATHTHSGPKTLDPIATEADSAVPKADRAYVQFMEEKIVESA